MAMVAPVKRVNPYMPLPYTPVETRRPSDIYMEATPKVGDVLSLEERAHQAEADAYRWHAYMQHRRNILDILLSGKNYA